MFFERLFEKPPPVNWTRQTVDTVDYNSIWSEDDHQRSHVMVERASSIHLILTTATCSSFIDIQESRSIEQMKKDYTVFAEERIAFESTVMVTENLGDGEPTSFPI
jgi:hypothetical protein